MTTKDRGEFSKRLKSSIVKCSDAFLNSDDGFIYIVMNYYDDGTLDDKENERQRNFSVQRFARMYCTAPSVTFGHYKSPQPVLQDHQRRSHTWAETENSIEAIISVVEDEDRGVLCAREQNYSNFLYPKDFPKGKSLSSLDGQSEYLGSPMKSFLLYCEGVFIKHLYQLLEKVKGHSSSKNIEGLMEILQKMKFPGEDGINVHRCRMTKSSMPFKQYSYFLMKLNSMRPITSTPRT
ncbi:hypothetical protein Q8A73_010603 [Channa argus]|nr:hypothetical protein Q8A73_010603 [Channa argus]